MSCCYFRGYSILFLAVAVRAVMQWLTWFYLNPCTTLAYFISHSPPKLPLAIYSSSSARSLPDSHAPPPLPISLPHCSYLVMSPLRLSSPLSSLQSPVLPIYVTWSVWSLAFFQSETISLTHNASQGTLREAVDSRDKWSQLVWLCVCGLCLYMCVNQI